MLIELTVENFMRVTTAHLSFKPGVNVVSGKNRAGKSSLFAAVDALVGGAAAEPEDPVHHGADKARIEGVYDTPNGKIRIEKVFRPDGERESFRVSSADGKESFKRPAELLEGLIGKGRLFDPRAFIAMKPKDRDAEVARIAGLNFESLDRRRQALYDERTQVNRDGKNAAGAVAVAPKAPDGTPDVEVDAADLSRQIAAAHSANRAAYRLRDQVDRCRADVADLRTRLQAATSALNAAEAQAATVATVDLPPLESALANAQATNALVRAKQARAAAVKRVDELHAKAEALTRQIDALDGDRQMMIEGAEYPVAGMGFDQEGRFTFNGVLFDQCSESEQDTIATAIGLKLRKVILIRDGSDFDEDGLRKLEEMVDEAGGQALIQIVKNRDDGVGFYIEDGQVAQREAVQA